MTTAVQMRIPWQRPKQAERCRKQTDSNKILFDYQYENTTVINENIKVRGDLCANVCCGNCTQLVQLVTESEWSVAAGFGETC